MKVQDIFRQMLDNMDGIVGHTTGNPANSMRGTDAATMVIPHVDNTDYTEKQTMIPPQFDAEQEHDCGCSDECECHDNYSAPDYEEEDALTDIRQLAGVQPIAIVQI